MTAALDISAGLEERIRAIVDERVITRLEELERSPWMGVKEAASHLRCGTSRLYKLTAADAIPHFKEEGRLLFNRAELDAWLENYRRGPGATVDRVVSNPTTVVAELLEEILLPGGDLTTLRTRSYDGLTAKVPRQRSDAPGPTPKE